MIFAVLGPFALACGFGTNGSSLREKIHAEHCHRPKVIFGVLGKSYDGVWTLCIAWCKPPYSKKYLRASGLLYLAERGGGESRVPSLWSF